jgi:outer membrane protein assembly factor BamB
MIANLKSFLPLLTILIVAGVPAAEPANGWRGNGTGLWPETNPPIEWHRIPRGAMEGLRALADKPEDAKAHDAALVEKGLIRNWLVLGPFGVKDSVADFDQDLLDGETNAEPSALQKFGDKTWSAATVPPDDIMVFGTAEMPWLDLAKAFGFQRNQIGYAHTYLFSPRGGAARIVVDHGHGLKAWVNGKHVYRAPQRGYGLGFYTAISKLELQHSDQKSPRFDIQLKPGWNRLLLKLSTSNKVDFTDMRCSLRIIDPPEVPYETRNIAWMTALPARSTSTPIMVGDRLFVMAEPDELLCLDKRDGRILWTRAINYYETVTAEECKKQPAYANRVDPLVAKLRQEKNRSKRLELHREIQKALEQIDPARFQIHANDHFEAHFGIVGFTMPTPVSDGTHVFVWSGMGVAASFDLDGERQWITRVVTDHLTYGSSPALADGVLVVFLNGLYGFDARSGKLLWEQPKVKYNVASLLATTFAGQQVIVTQRGDIIRPGTGEILYRPRGSSVSGDVGWSPPVILGSRLYLPKYGVNEVSELEFANVKPPDWEPKLIKRLALPEEMSRGPGGKWIDRWTAGSPLVWDGIIYEVDIYQTLYTVDLKSGKMLYRQELPLRGFMHYNSVPVAASPTLVGKHILIADNQGTTLVLEPGPTYKLVATNRIDTQLDRAWPIPAQETLMYSPPIADGKRLYLRGEAYLYCVGEKQ